MLKAFVETLVDLATKGIRPTLIPELTTRRGVVLAHPDGTTTVEPRELPDRWAKVATLLELAKIAAEVETADDEHGKAIFLDESGATLLLETAGGEDRVACPFVLSNAWELLRQLDKDAGCALDQKTFLRRGRFTLRMTPDQLDPFRRLDFTVDQTARGEFRRTSESMDGLATRGRAAAARGRAGGRRRGCAGVPRVGLEVARGGAETR